MNVNWQIATFDWNRFRELEPTFIECEKTGNFLSIELPEAESLLENWSEDESGESLCNALIQVACCSEESAEFPAGFPELIRWLRKQDKMEDAAESLATLISAEPHVDEWFKAEFGIAGILDVWQTRELSDQLKYFEANFVQPPSPRGIAGFARRFSTVDTHSHQIRDLMTIVFRASEAVQGIVAIRP